MARKTRAAEGTDPWWLTIAVGAVFLVTHLIFLPGAASPFRLPKEALATGGLAVVAALGLGRCLIGGRLRLPQGPLPLILGVYPCLLATSALCAASPRRATASAALAAVWVVGVLWLGTLGHEARRRILRWTTVGVSISAVVLLLQLAGVNVIELQPETARARLGLTGLAGNPADLAMGVILLLPLILPTRDESRSWRRWVVPGALAAVAAVTQTLTGIAALLTLLGVWLVVHGSRRAWLAAAAAVVVLSGIAIGAGVGPRIAHELQSLRSGDRNAILSARGDGWSAAAQMIRDQPLLGVGAGGFDHLFAPARVAFLERHGGTGSRGEMATHFEWAHNDPLQVVAELGLAGALWLLALVAGILHHRRRGDPVPLLGAAALAPFLLLHYPSHLAISMVPIALLLAHLLHTPTPVRIVAGGAGRPVAVALLALAVLVAAWQVRRVEEDRWFGRSENALLAAQVLGGARAMATYVAVEREAAQRLQRTPGSAGRLWRLIGRIRHARGDPAGAEAAFRTAIGLWPHEEAELGLGLALEGQGRRTEALSHLGRVCRINPRLVELIPDQDLRRAVRSYLAEIQHAN